MKKRKIALKHFGVVSLLVLSLIACEKDFANLDSDLTDGSTKHFNTEFSDYPVIAYTQPVPIVQTSNITGQQLTSALLGYYNDPLLGGTTSNFLTTLALNSYAPNFGNNAALDSVVLTVPYFSTQTGVDTEGEPIFRLDSVYGNAPIDLFIYRSNYFLRDKDPNSNINADQLFYSNQSDGVNFISDTQLESELLFVKNNFIPSSEVDSSLAVPSLKLKLTEPEDLVYWQNNIIDKENGSELSNAANFKNYFRGLYFKVNDVNNDGNAILLNLAAGGAITLYYSRDSDTDENEKVQASLALNFGSKRATFIENDFTIQEGDMVNGDEKLYLKGGAGSIAVINLFNGENFDDQPEDNAFEQFKKEFVNTDEDGNYVSTRKLINEANLVFYVDQQTMSSLNSSLEPENIYLYNLETGTFLPNEFGIGALLREGEDGDGRGIKYSIKVTEFIKGLLLLDNPNVKLGLAVLGNIEKEFDTPQLHILTPNDEQNLSLPSTSLSTPKATVLFGNNTTEQDKKLYLELFYTNIEQ